MRTIQEMEEKVSPVTTPGSCMDAQSTGELEMEVATLKEKLRATHAAVTRTQVHMEAQKKRTKQLVAAWKVRLEEGEEKLRQHKEFLDSQLQKIVSELLFFESALRREQRDIKDDLHNKDQLINSQKQTIDSLISSNVELTKAVKKLKRKYKEAIQLNSNNETHNQSLLIQQEADALISQIFANNRNFLSKQSASPFTEQVPERYESAEDERQNITIEEPKTRQPPVAVKDDLDDKHVFFCLTKSEDETNGSSMKLVTNTSSIPLSTVYDSERDQSFSLEGPIFTEDPHSQMYGMSSGNTLDNQFVYDLNTDCSKGDYHVTQDKMAIQKPNLSVRRPPLVSTKSCPNLGLSVIQEDLQMANFDSDKAKLNASADMLSFDYENEGDPLSDSCNSDVFTSSHNSFTSLCSLERVHSVGDEYQEGIYEILPESFDTKNEYPKDGKRAESNSKDEVKLEQRKSPSRVSSFNLLKRIRRSSDAKKQKKAARTASDGDQTKEKDRHKRKLTL